MVDHTIAIGGHDQPGTTWATLHLESALLIRILKASTTPVSLTRRAFSRTENPQIQVLTERSGLGANIFRAACHGATTHLGVDGERKMAVNLSARQLLSPALTDTIENVLRLARMSPSSLVVEITESVVLHDVAASSHALHALKDLGLGIAVDDFGTGYSSLLYLKGLPIDELKIDRAFVSGLGKDPQDLVIVTAIIDMAHGLGITTTAEGVEDPKQVEILHQLGCERAQGFYWTPPLPAEEIARWISAPT